MSRAETRVIRKWAISIAAVLIAALGCSTDSPTAPVQTPAPPSGTQASAVWNITVTTQPKELTAEAEQPATVSVRIRRADDNQPPPNGTTFVISTTLGEFGFAGSGLGSAALSTANGRSDVLFFPGAVIGTALITAQLELSAGQLGLPIVAEIEPVEASFDFANSQDNLSIQFQNTSTGDPTKFKWDFGDGETSREENPAHLYRFEGDYVVTLTVSKPGSKDSASQLVAVTEDPELVVVASFVATVSAADPQTVIFQDTSTGNPTSWSWDFGDGTTSRDQNPTHRYGRAGTFVVTLKAKNSRTEDETSQVISTSEDLFVVTITPNTVSSAGGTTVTITGTGFTEPLNVFIGGKLATLVSVSGDRKKIVVKTPPLGTDTVSCDDDGDEFIGFRNVATAVDLSVTVGSGGSITISGGITVLPTDGTTCFDD